MRASNSPLVSVIIRSLGRASLVSSVESVLAQTHRPVEVVIVHAGGTALPALGPFPSLTLRVVDAGPLNRPRAANAGLSSARGDWLVFLDDDDTFLPGHLESLLRKQSEMPDALVAYSATECIDASGTNVETLAREFDRLRLFERNYIQIGAALFSRRVVDEGYRFDEAFECLQDWDFWIQLAQRTRFVFTGSATNRWCAFSGGSGCGRGSNSDPARYVPFRRLLRQKWSALAADLTRKVRHHESLAELATKRGRIDEAERHLAAVRAIVRGAPAKVRVPAVKPRIAHRLPSTTAQES